MPVASLDVASEKCRQAPHVPGAQLARLTIPESQSSQLHLHPARRSRRWPAVGSPDQGSGQACIHLIAASRSCLLSGHHGNY